MHILLALRHPSGKGPIPEIEYVSHLFSVDAIIPRPIFDYLQNYGDAVTHSEDKVSPSFPAVAVPSDGSNDTLSGMFGHITAADHKK